MSVEDDGLGIEPEMLESIFDPFTTGSDHAEHGEAGLGLGLTLVRRLVDVHEGSVEARSRGTGFGASSS